jgi:hypothetical protein
MMRTVYLVLIAIVALALVNGCNRSAYEVAPVHGVVTVDGKPLFQGKVMYAPVAVAGGKDPGRPAWGNIASDGAYRMSTYSPGDGAIIGEHWVTIVNSKEELPDDVPEFARFIVPTKFKVVPGTDNKIDIALTSETIEEFREDDR